MKILPASKFTWQNYIANSWIEIEDAWNFKTNKIRFGYIEIGRIKANKLNVKPRERGWAVMVEKVKQADSNIDDSDFLFEPVWFHIRGEDE